ncbi:hypothetical protein [Chromobacterium sphagni]|uniref:hypothetical protein n=1 Tax=Chromobacterium sphagni TaxID=1903179 RepID=UPI0011143304|nr:hypothetical protein [Chromobacterium sphagni]
MLEETPTTTPINAFNIGGYMSISGSEEILQPHIKATIECDGTYWQVRLHAIPLKGQLIKFFSFLDVQQGEDRYKNFEVVEVVHDVRDVIPDDPRYQGHHEVRLVVRPSTSTHFSFK